MDPEKDDSGGVWRSNAVHENARGMLKSIFRRGDEEPYAQCGSRDPSAKRYHHRVALKVLNDNAQVFVPSYEVPVK